FSPIGNGLVEDRTQRVSLQLVACCPDNSHDFQNNRQAETVAHKLRGLLNRASGRSFDGPRCGPSFRVFCPDKNSCTCEARQFLGSQGLMCQVTPHGGFQGARQSKVSVSRDVEKNHLAVDVAARKMLSEVIFHCPSSEWGAHPGCAPRGNHSSEMPGIAGPPEPVDSFRPREPFVSILAVPRSMTSSRNSACALSFVFISISYVRVMAVP